MSEALDAYIDVQIASAAPHIPSEKAFQCWVQASLQSVMDTPEVSIRVVDAEEMQALNRDYRHKDKPTNVLSFPCELPEGVEISHLGDIVLCVSVIEREAQDQQKSLEAHWAHMVVHGMLHLQGFDHESTDEAAVMEALETKILTVLHYPPPYSGEGEW